MRAAIIGGGWAGLSAAVELVKAGIEVTVFEAARQLGGRARSVEVHGRRLDNGQHILLGAYRDTLRLMREVGVGVERVLKRLPLELFFPASHLAPFHLRLPRLPSPWNLAAGLLTTRGASLHEKISAARCLRNLQSTGYRIGDDCTVTALLDRHGQYGSLRRHLWEPLCLAALNTAPEQASAQIFLTTLRDSLGGGQTATNLLLPAADLDELFPTAAANYIRAKGGEIRLATRVEAIADGPTVSGERFAFAVLAVGPQHAAAILARHPQTLAIAQRLADYRFEPIATVYCGYPPQLRLPLPMLGLGVGDRAEIGQWVFDRGILCGTAGVLAFVLSGHAGWEDLDNAVLAATLHRELAATLPGRLPTAAWQQVIRERRATFSCRPQLYRPPAHTACAGLWLAGDYVCAEYPATLEAAVRSGVTAAREILLSASLRVAPRASADDANSARQALRHG